MTSISVHTPDLGPSAYSPRIAVDVDEGVVLVDGLDLDVYNVDLVLTPDEAKALAAVLLTQAFAVEGGR